MFTKAVYSYLFFLCSFAVFYISIFVLAVGAFSFASFLFHSKMWCLFLGNQQFFLSLGCLSTLHFFLAGKISLPISANLHDESKFFERTFWFEVFIRNLLPLNRLVVSTILFSSLFVYFSYCGVCYNHKLSTYDVILFKKSSNGDLNFTFYGWGNYFQRTFSQINIT